MDLHSLLFTFIPSIAIVLSTGGLIYVIRHLLR